MKRLWVLYDAECVLCNRVRKWLGRQPAFVPLAFRPLQSAAAIFPGIAKFHPEEQLVVISDSGEVWQGDAAWIMVLWALRETREWSLRLASPALRPLARAACHLLSQNRYTISRWLGGDSEEELRRKLVGATENPAHGSCALR